MNDATFENWLDYYSNFCGPFVENPANKNLTGVQKELLLRHWKIILSRYLNKKFMIENIYKEPAGKRTILPPIVVPKLSKLSIFLSQLVSPVCWLVPRGDEIGPLRLRS